MSTLRHAMRHSAALAVSISFVLLAISGSSQSADPVETNKLAAEAEALIHKQFDPDDCAVVMFAEKTQDGTIDAVCNNGEAFRVTSKMALRCAAMEHLGVEGCTRWNGGREANMARLAIMSCAANIPPCTPAIRRWTDQIKTQCANSGSEFPKCVAEIKKPDAPAAPSPLPQVLRGSGK